MRGRRYFSQTRDHEDPSGHRPQADLPESHARKHTVLPAGASARTAIVDHTILVVA